MNESELIRSRTQVNQTLNVENTSPNYQALAQENKFKDFVNTNLNENEDDEEESEQDQQHSRSKQKYTYTQELLENQPSGLVLNIKKHHQREFTEDFTSKMGEDHEFEMRSTNFNKFKQ